MQTIRSARSIEAAARQVIAALALFAVAGAPAVAAQVKLCKTDIEGGTGAANLETAIFAGGPITFQCPTGSTILFTRPHLVTRATQIYGGNTVTLDGNEHTMFRVQNGVALRFADIAIRRGVASLVPIGPPLPGGVVLGDAQVELLRTSVSKSLNAFWLTTGSIRIRKSRFLDNKGISVHAPAIEIADGSQFLTNSGTPVLSTAGAVTIADSQFAGNGTSEFSNCTLAIRNSTFNAHVGTGNGGALRINCNATIESSEFHNNRAIHGGAIYVGGGPTEVSMRRVKFVGNIAEETGGAIAIEPSASTLILKLRNSIFDSNRASQGGAINFERFYGSNGRVLHGAAVTFKRNGASQRGGAIYAINAGLRIARSAFIDNDAVEGGGAVFAMQQGIQSAEFANSLFVHNNSTQGGSAFQGDAASFINSTIAANSGTAVWPEAAVVLPFGGTVPTVFPIRFSNSILMQVWGSPCGPAAPTVPYLDQGHNIQFFGASCGVSIPSAYPALGPFFVPWPWSPALNNGDNAICAAAPVNSRDIFGIRRPLLDNCAIGAAEGDIPHLVNKALRSNRELLAIFGSGKKKTLRPPERPTSSPQ